MALSLPFHGPLLDDRFPLPLDAPFSTRSALEAGLSPRDLRRLVAEGFLRRPFRGAYLAAQAPDDRATRGAVLSLVVPPGSVVTDWSATYYWTGTDHPAALEGPQPLSVFRFSGHERLRNHLTTSGQRMMSADDVVPLGRQLLVTTPLCTAWHLGRFASPVLALGGMDVLARHAELDLGELRRGVERFARQRGVVRLRGLAPMVDPLSESMGESGLRWHWLAGTDLPRPRLQIPVVDHDGTVYRLDSGIEALRYAAEYDGAEFHSSVEHHAHDVRRRRHLAELGWMVEVFRREDVYGHSANAVGRLVQTVAEARRTLAERSLTGDRVSS